MNDRWIPSCFQHTWYNNQLPLKVCLIFNFWIYSHCLISKCFLKHIHQHLKKMRAFSCKYSLVLCPMLDATIPPGPASLLLLVYFLTTNSPLSPLMSHRNPGSMYEKEHVTFVFSLPLPSLLTALSLFKYLPHVQRERQNMKQNTQ